MGDRSLPIDRGWAWMIVIGYFTSIFCMAGIGRSFGIFIEEFVNHFDTSVAMAASVMGVYGGVYTLSAPICVAAGEQFSQRKVVMVGGVVGATGLCLSALLINMEWVIVVIGVLFGIGNGSIFGNGLVMINQYFDKRRSLANGLALSGASIGLFAIPPLLQFLLDKYSLQGTLVIVGGIYLHVTVCGTLYRPLSYFEKSTVNSALLQGHDALLPSQSDSKHVSDTSDTNNSDHTSLEHCTEKQVNASCPNHDECHDTLFQRDTAIECSISCLENYASYADKEKTGTSNLEVDVTHAKSNDSDISPQCVDKTMIKTEKWQNICDEEFAKIILTTEKKTLPEVLHNVRTFMTRLLDFSVLKNVVAVLFVIASFLFFFGHFNFLLFMPATAFRRGVSKYQKAYLVSINGMCDLVGRLSVGAIGDLKLVKRYVLLSIATFLCGASIFSFTFAHSFLSMAICGGLYGFFGGGYVTINVPALIDLVGMKDMPKVLGVVLFIQGIGAAVGLPLLGALRDITGSFYIVHCINGLAMMLGAVILLTYSCVRKP